MQPIELAKRLIKEMDAGRTVGVSEVWAPNHFAFSLSAEDGARLEQAEAAMAAELKTVVLENASERGWGMVGPPEIEFLMDDKLRRGDFVCEASLVEGEQKVAPTAAANGYASLVVHEDGAERTVALRGEAATIGRLPECEVILKDKGASRRHAQIKLKDGLATLTDLGSTNGTRLNGSMVQSRALEDGDRITIGSTVLEFRRG